MKIAQSPFSLLDQLLAAWENEVVEFKRADTNFKTSEIGHYYSALSNEANLRGLENGWLVFGVDNKKRQVVGTDYRWGHEHLMALKNDVRNGLEPSMTFQDVLEIQHPKGRVLLFKIPPAPAGIPVGWHGHRYARSGESLCALGVDKEDTIRSQASRTEWTAESIPEAKISDLDPAAIARAKQAFAGNHASRFSGDEVANWPDVLFLQKLGLIHEDAPNRAALLLLGREESARFLNPHPAQITWKLQKEPAGYEHYGPPFLLNTSKIFQRIRNFKVRLLPSGELIGQDVEKYEQTVVLEALHNAIAHQDYRQSARILLTEGEDDLEVENAGDFYEGTPDMYIEGTRTPRRYRNTCLVKAMAMLGMIDTMGYGIHRMYRHQALRSFPLPDYDLGTSGGVRLRIYGKIVDPAYTKLLLQKTNIPLVDILGLDRIQKNIPVDDTVLKRLRKGGWVEGRKPHLHISAKIAAVTASRSEYIRTRALDDNHYQRLIVEYLQKFGKASRTELDDLLLSKLSEALSDKQKKAKIHNLLTKLRFRNEIMNQGSRGQPCWVLVKGRENNQP